MRRGLEGKTDIVSAEAWLVIYQLKFQEANVSFISGLWERELERQLLEYSDPFVQQTFFHSQTLSEELKRNAEQLVPRFAISFTILVVFAVLCSSILLPRTLTIDWVTSKPLLAGWGVLNAGLAVVAAIGLLNFAGMPFNDIVLIMPFMAIGEFPFIYMPSIVKSGR